MPGGRLTATRATGSERRRGGSWDVCASTQAPARRGLTGEPGVPPCALTSARGAEDFRAPARSRRARAVLGRLRRGRLLDLHRARDHRPARAGPHARGARPRRRPLPRRLALLRRGHDGDSRDRWRRHLRPSGVQRPRRLPDRLGALPRLPDRDRAFGALHAALPRGGAQVAVARAQSVGRRGRGRRDHGRRCDQAGSALRVLPLRDLRRRARPLDAADARRARLRIPVLRRGAHPRDLDRIAPELAPDRLRAPARDARLYGSRDRRQPRRGGARARPGPAAEPLLRDRARRRDLRRDRARGPLRVPGAGRHDQPRHATGSTRR